MKPRNFQQELAARLREKSPLIQVVIGPRQVGKSTAAHAIAAHWKGPQHMVTADGPVPPNAEWLQLQWNHARQLGTGTLFIVDEVQKISGWSEMLKRLFDPIRGRGLLKIVLLGSSSLYLQKGLSESLAGRFEVLPAPHWSFAECHREFGWDFATYLRWGAYPGAVPFVGKAARWRSYLRDGLIEPVLGRDVVGQNVLRNPALFRQTFELVSQCPAQVVSLQKLLGQLQDRGNAATIRHYLTLLEQVFFVRCLHKFSGSVVQSRSSSPKIIIMNPALTHAYQAPERLDTDPHWYGLMFENVVGAHLAQWPEAELYYWRDGTAEVDFVVKTPRALYAIEVKSGRRVRSERGLIRFAEHYPKAICQSWDAATAIDFMAGKRTL